MPRLLHHISVRYPSGIIPEQNQAEHTAFCATLRRNRDVARGQIRKCGENQRNADQTPVLGFRDLRF